MSYQLESEMIPALMTSLAPLLVKDAPYVVACEVPDGSRVVDVMYAVLPTTWRTSPEEDFAAKLGRLSIAQAVVLSLLWREQRMSLHRLSRLSFVSEDRLVAEYLGPMERADLVARDGRSWCVTEWAQRRPPHLIAVEAKLRDWREAMSQAVDNRKRSDESYIALPRMDNRQRASTIRARATEFGIGVVEVDADGAATITTKARRVPARESHGKWGVAVRLLGKECPRTL